jgi:hypothetical protein
MLPMYYAPEAGEVIERISGEFRALAQVNQGWVDGL